MRTVAAVWLSAAMLFVGLPTANALPGQCWNTPFGGFCDSAAQADGSFQHCESIGFGSSLYRNCFQACHDPVSNRAIPTDLDWETPC